MTKILLVDDNDINREMLSRRLERKGYQVIVAINGAEGVAKTQADPPDLVLMDLHLPVLDGWEATRQIKANPQTRSIPVIALTADAIEGEREKALAAGCDEYDTKPVNFTQLLEKIARLLKPALQPSESLNLSPDQPLQRLLLTRLRHDLEPLIHTIIGYGNMLLDALNEPQNSELQNNESQNNELQNSTLCSDLQKIHVSGLQLLSLVQAILNPVLMTIQPQDWTITLFAPTLRRELLTPLSTIIGYCELLLEEAPADLISDLEQIYTSAQDLLSLVNSLDNLMTQHLQSIRTIDLTEPYTAEQMLETPEAEIWRRYAIKTDQSSLKDSRILIVGNNASSTLLSRQLERQGHQVTIATVSEQILEILSAMPCDLVLLDVSQPNGLKILEQLKQQGAWRNIPVLIMAAPDEMERIVRGIAMGATDYLTSPFHPVLLRAKVTACLEQGRLRAQRGNFDSLWENAPIGVYQAAVEGCLRSVNPALVRLLGYPDAATLMETITTIADQIYVDSNRYADLRCLLEEHDQVTGFEYQAYRYDGDIIWVSEHSRAVRDSSGQIIYYEGIVEEITQRKLAEAARNQQLEALRLELGNLRRTQQVAEFVQTDYFQQLQPCAEAQQNSYSSVPSPLKVLPLKVLLIEDNELNSDMLSRRLQRYGYEVVIASDGAEGVTKALSEQPHVILMDISLPVMDGWEATQHLKADPQTCQIPIIALTAHAMAGDREKALAAGCDDYDTKPIELPRLLSKIEGCLKPLAFDT